MINIQQIKVETYNLLKSLFGERFIRDKYLSYSVDKYIRADCVFVHIPKAAGTSVAREVIGERAGHFSALEIKEFLGDEKYNNMFSFSITRNPLNRLQSAYYFVINGGGEHGGVKRERYFNSYTFRSFDAFVQEWLVHQDLAKTNLLFRPQVNFLQDEEGGLLVDYLGKVEDMGAVEKVLSDKLSKKVSFQELNRTITKFKKPHDVSCQTIRTVEYLYSEDYSILNY